MIRPYALNISPGRFTIPSLDEVFSYTYPFFNLLRSYILFQENSRLPIY